MNIKTSLNKIFNYKFLSILTIINKYFWKTKTGPIFAIVMPLIFMIIYFALGETGNKGEQIAYFLNGVPAYFAMTIIPLSILTLPAMIVEFRNSILLRKIKTSGVNSINFNLTCLFYYFFISLAFALFVFLIVVIISSGDISKLNSINWGGVVYGILFLILSSISLGLFLSSFLKNNMSAQLIGTGIYFLTLILGGQFIPIQVIGRVDAIKYISLFSPLNYSTSLMNIASLPTPATLGSDNNIFNFSSSFQIVNSLDPSGTAITLYDVWQKILFVFMPIVLSVILFPLGIKFFKWTSR